ncbi:MAG: 1-phosphofructokinase family hexose kinase [Hydrogenophaga sp.]|uniref:1-phosphofructokinase family hexose kinase n=1 Tax=Hydrogenophaga sp. TaxID=1904254 RepID=UPI00276CDED2|nr:1-phosphofructokinase family hexose kinase [Hydrogenophaga sp.]MDP2416583.1 1-phosphofructokinase family hexose kinase [Hydrogenophaga sp.]MDZ4187816.1 1-phosphofructokinase family hexose kinase [Hydrogenophaga sp.]
MHTPSPPLRILCLTMNPSVDLATETERVVPTHKLRCGDTLHDAGGGGINVARVLARLGGHCTALCPTGGSSGQWLQTRMAQEGMHGIFLPIAGETRVSFTVHEHSTGAEYRFVMPGPRLSDAEWQACLQYLQNMPDFPDLLVASGSLPPGVPPDFDAQLARLCRERGARLVLDTSGPALAAALTEGVYLVKPNLRELSELSGQTLETPEQWEKAARALVVGGQAQVVALTMGHLGALLVTREGAWFAQPLPIQVASAVGAGDSFVGGMVWALQHHHPLAEAFAWGVAAGSAALLSVGTGLCCKEDAQQLFAQVQAVPCERP